MSEIIQSLWVGRPLSLIEQLAITSFLKNGHEFHLYCYEKIENVPPGVKVMDAAAILPASEIFYYETSKGRGSVAAFANLFRYKLLFEKGGWWTDTDVVCVRPFDFREPVVIGGEDKVGGGTKAANAIMKLPPSHEIARLCYEAAGRADRKNLRWAQTGPNLVDRIVRESGLEFLIQPPEVFCPVPHWDWKTLIRPQTNGARQIGTEKTRAVHLWHEMWRRTGVDLVPLEKKSRVLRAWLVLRRRLGIKPKLSVNEKKSVFGRMLRENGLRK